MSILIWIIFGALVGGLASYLMRSEHSIWEDIFLGILGAFVGGFLMNISGGAGVTGFNMYSFFVAIAGSVVIIYLGRLLNR